MPVSDYTPEVPAVAAFLRARTKTEGGEEAGTFNPAAYWTDNSGRGTRPTAEQATEQIANAIGDISGIVGEDIDERFHEPAKRVVALRAALLIELSYFPEQVATGRSPYAQLKELYDEAWGNLKSALGIDTDEGVVVPTDAGYPSYGGFPETAIGMEHPW